MRTYMYTVYTPRYRIIRFVGETKGLQSRSMACSSLFILLFVFVTSGGTSLDV